MFINELIEKPKAIRSWADAKLDAESKGLTLSKWQSGYHLEPNNYNEISKALQAKGFSWQDYSMLVAHPRTIRDYPKAAETIVANMGSLPQIIDNVTSQKREHALNDLSELQRESLSKKPHGVPQLFMPRPQIHTTKPYWYYRQFGYDENGKEITESTRPILPPAHFQPRPGSNKPNSTFWTSSLKKEYTDQNTHITYYGSEWVDYVCHSMRDTSYSNIGHVYQISPSARILSIRDNYDAKNIYKLYMDLGASLNQEALWSDNIDLLKADFPWNEISKHWDGIYHEPGWNDGYGFTYTYDCTSCAWFNTDVLDYIGKVRIRPCDYEPPDDDENY